MKGRRGYIKKILFGLAALCLVGGEGCRSMVEKNRKVIIVLIDYSASGDQAVLENYIRIVNEAIFSNMGKYDCLTVVPVDEGSKLQPVKLVNEDLAEQKFSRPGDGFAHAQDSAKARFAAYVAEESPKIAETLKAQKIQRSRFTEFTDLIGAVQQTANLIEFNKKSGAVQDAEDFVSGHVRLRSENIIVLLSDMIQDSRDYSFNNRAGVTYQQSRKYLDQLGSTDKIPDLKDCKVFCIGATGKNSSQIDNIGVFWRDYFQKTHADLKAYGFSVDDKLRKYLKESAE